MSEAAVAEPPVRGAPLASLWGAMAPRGRPAPPAVADVTTLLAEAERRGHAAGSTAADAALAPRLTLLDRAAAALAEAAMIDAEALRPLFVDLVTRIATAVVDGELRISGEAVARLVDAALAAVEGGAATVFVHPDDRTLLPDGPARVVADPELARGEVRVETAAHVVAASLTARLASIVAGLA